MQLFIDSGKLEDIKYAMEKYPLDGVTTNPIILARDIEEGLSFTEYLSEIRRLSKDKKMFVQVTSRDTDGMVFQAEKIAKTLGGDVCIKVPSNICGFEAVKRLKTLGIKTTATALYTPSQALIAAKCGAEYVAPYISHIDNLSLDGPKVAGDISKLLISQGFETKVLAAAFRTAAQVERCFENGAFCATVTREMLDIMASHGGTEKEISSFENHWQAKYGNKEITELF